MQVRVRCRLVLHFLSVYGELQAEGIWSLSVPKVSSLACSCVAPLITEAVAVF